MVLLFFCASGAVLFAAASTPAPAAGQGGWAVAETLPDAAQVLGAAEHGGVIFVATEKGLWRKAADGKLSPVWTPSKAAISHGPLVTDGRIFVVSDFQLLASALDGALSFKPVETSAKVEDLPRRVHDRWIVETDLGARQSRDLLKWEPLFAPETIYAKHLAWLDGAWWALQNPPPAKPDPAKKIADGEADEAAWSPGMGGGRLAPQRVTMQLRRSTDLRQWTTVRDVEVSLIDTGLFSFAGKLVAVGEAGVDILPLDAAGHAVTADETEMAVRAAVAGSRMWLTTGSGLLVSGENDPVSWTWMNGTESFKNLPGQITALSAAGPAVALGTSSGVFALLQPDAQARVASGGRAFASFIAAPQFAIRKLVRAGNNYFAIGGDDALHHTRPGETSWSRVPLRGKSRVHDIATDGKNTLLVSLSEEWKMNDGRVSHSHKTHTFALNDTARPHYRDLRFRQSPNNETLRLHHGGGRFVAWGFKDVMTTADGNDWEVVTLPGDHLRPKAVHYADGRYLVLLADDKGVLRTRDFKTWEPRIPALIGGYLENAYATAGDGRAIFQYSPRGVDSQSGKVYYEDKLSISTDGGATWTAVSGLSASPATRLLGALDEAGERHWLVFNDGLFSTVGNSLVEWRRIAALDQRRLVTVGSDGGDVVEIVPARGLVPFSVNRDLLPGSQSVAIRQVPASPVEYLLAAFIEWDNTASAATDIAGLKAATQTFTRAIAGGTDVEKTEAGRLRSLALRRLALFAPLDDIFEVAGPFTFDAIKHNIVAGEQARVQRALHDKISNANVRVSGSGAALPAYERDYQRLAKNWKPRATKFTLPKPEKPELLGYADRRIMQTRAFRGEAGSIIDLFIGYGGGGVGIISSHASVWWNTEAPQRPKRNDSAGELDRFFAQHGSAWSKLDLLNEKLKAPEGGKAPPPDAAALAELEQLFQQGMNYAAYWLADEYNRRYHREAPATRTPLGQNAQLMRIWARRGAERGYAPSMVRLAQACSHGIGGAGREEPAAAVEWARRAVATGHPMAAKIFNPTELALMENDIVMGGRSKRMTAEQVFDPAIMDSIVAGYVDLGKRVVAEREQEAVGGAKDDGRILTDAEQRLLDLERAGIEKMPPGDDKDDKLEAHENKWGELIQYRKLSRVLHMAATMSDDEATGFLRTATLESAKKTWGGIFGKTPLAADNRLQLVNLNAYIAGKVPAADQPALFDRILRDVPTLADIWAIRAGLHFDAGEIAAAEGKLAVARLINPKDAAVLRTQKKMKPAPAAASAGEASGLTPEANYALGLEYEQGKRGGTAIERADKAASHYKAAAETGHVASMMALVRILGASLQDGDFSEQDKNAIEGEVIRWVFRAADLGNGEALRMRASWRYSGMAGLRKDTVLAIQELEQAAEAGDLTAMRLLIQAAQTREWRPPEPQAAVDKLIQKLADAGEADAVALLRQREEQKKLELAVWGPKGAPVPVTETKPAAVPATAVTVSGVPKPLMDHIQLGRPASTAPRTEERARALLAAMLDDEKIDATERALLLEIAKPSFRLRLQQKTGAGEPRELVFIGSYDPAARAFIQRLTPPEGSDAPEMMPLMRRYFWMWGGGTAGWQRALAHASASATGREEMVDTLARMLGEKWTAARGPQYEVFRDALAIFENSARRLDAAGTIAAFGLLFDACQRVDKKVNDAMPDHLYTQFKREIERLRKP